MVVENRTGAGGSIGATAVARAPADGYTLLLGSSSEIALYPQVASNVPYDSQRDFIPIALLATVPLVLTAAEGLPVRSVGELLAYARQKGFSSPRKVIALVGPVLERLKLRFQSYAQPVSALSGGNQQKVVLAKWLATAPSLLILDEPTQGIDVQSKAEVHAMIADLAAQGMAIVLVSSEMPELIGMCDRIVVLHEGLKTAEFSRAEATPEAVLRAATARRRRRHARGGGGRGRAGEAPRPRRRASRAPRARPPRGDGGGGDPGLARQPADAEPGQPDRAGDGRGTPRHRHAGPAPRAHHPQHRPLGRLGDRAGRLRLGADHDPRSRRSGLPPASPPAAPSGSPAGW